MVSKVSNSGSLSSCKSLLYVSGNPFNIVSIATRLPNTLPDLALPISAKSGFLFWGIMLLPVVKSEPNFAKSNSSDIQITISSHKRDICTAQIADAE